MHVSFPAFVQSFDSNELLIHMWVCSKLWGGSVFACIAWIQQFCSSMIPLGCGNWCVACIPGVSLANDAAYGWHIMLTFRLVGWNTILFVACCICGELRQWDKYILARSSESASLWRLGMFVWSGCRFGMLPFVWFLRWGLCRHPDRDPDVPRIFLSWWGIVRNFQSALVLVGWTLLWTVVYKLLLWLVICYVLAFKACSAGAPLHWLTYWRFPGAGAGLMCLFLRDRCNWV